MKIIHSILYLSLFLILYSCKKDWLEAKPDKKLVVPETLTDLQAMLDNTTFVFNNYQPTLGELGCDDYYVMDADYESLFTSVEKNSYVWAKEIYNNELVADWMMPYQRIFYENYILEKMPDIEKTPENAGRWENVKGSALFGRGYDFYSLADLFAKPFDSATAAKDAGLPLRLESDINGKTERATVKETYVQILNDLESSLQFLPPIPAYQTRPSRAAAFAMLARTYLSMGDYVNALQYADSCLALQPALIDYNTLDADAPFPFPIFNEEVIYHAAINYYYILSSYVAILDSTIFRAYDENDLRKYLFVDTTDGFPRFKGGYDGYVGFAGIATDEIYLTSAECNARTGNLNSAMERLNTLLETRWRSGTFVPFTANTIEEALDLIYQERRKELIFRGLRWTDLRRLNKDPRFAVTLTREVNGQIYTLPPNDLRYTYPLPENEILLSGIEQNPR